ncbi:hypothetical protein HYPSUDRAFT_63538 [Hypholoma sublateritium FD-334 SS-4]|uniref:Peptidase A1 domain-containing protein n=1 Tax=Hypholoma sublateritium (strain FD-334 SS-4) TaxID=945553 RepID=A0A0D2P727_HYPSF|nr:hypothetical protein HYPSUDRAFT_63538 [Hypholoma sublateritium FD-334 SS-4]
MFLTTLLPALLLALCVVAKPVALRSGSSHSLPISKRLNTTSIHNLVHHDQLRAKYLKSRACFNGGLDTRTNQPVENQAVQYIATIGVGSPITNFSLAVDTGSSNTWIGADTDNPYVKTSSSSATSNNVTVYYGSGSFSGTEYIDKVTLTPELVISKQSIGVASQSSGFSGIDGILGIGPVDLTAGTLSPSESASIPTLTDNLFAAGTIAYDSIAISFAPTTVESIINGEISWGATDSKKYTGSITYSPLTSTSPASEYWGVDISVVYGKSHTVVSETAGIVDTGTTLILFATDYYKKYKSATGATDDSTTGLIKFTSSQYSKLSSLFVTFGGETFELTANAQIWPRSLNTAIGGTSSSIYGVVSDLGSSSGEGLDFILGYTFLERFYSVYDTGNARVGLATTSHTTATSN